MKKFIPLIGLVAVLLAGCDDMPSKPQSGTWLVCWRSNNSYYKVITHNKPNITNNIVYVIKDDGKAVTFSGNWYVQEN